MSVTLERPDDVRSRVGAAYDLRAGSVELVLRMLLPPEKGRSSTERLMALAGRALADGTRTVRPKLKPPEREDLESHLFEVGVRCVTVYDPSLDSGTGSVPLDRRFASFCYIRMRMRLVDWLRENRGDTRPGRSRIEEEPSSHSVLADPDRQANDPAHDDGVVSGAHPELVEEDFVERLVSRTTVERWSVLASSAGMTMTDWAVDRLNAVADMESSWDDAA
jgi:hypothetical protein